MIKIQYYTISNYETSYSYTFTNVKDFKNFINECHKQINEKQYDEFIQYYNNILAEEKKDITIYTTINGDNIYFTKYYGGLKEIIENIKTTQKLLTTNLINIINCNSWHYEFKPNEITTVEYTVDKNNQQNNNCQIYIYTNMIVCYSPNTTYPHILKTDKVNVRYKNN